MGKDIFVQSRVREVGSVIKESGSRLHDLVKAPEFNGGCV